MYIYIYILYLQYLCTIFTRVPWIREVGRGGPECERKGWGDEDDEEDEEEEEEEEKTNHVALRIHRMRWHAYIGNFVCAASGRGCFINIDP